jgi:hypothetical protein
MQLELKNRTQNVSSFTIIRLVIVRRYTSDQKAKGNECQDAISDSKSKGPVENSHVLSSPIIWITIVEIFLEAGTKNGNTR